MGSQQTKVTPEVVAHEKALLDRLRALQLENKEAGDYVFVHDSANEKRANGGTVAVRAAEDISVEQAQEWQKRLLEDPKNR